MISIEEAIRLDIKAAAIYEIKSGVPAAEWQKNVDAAMTGYEMLIGQSSSFSSADIYVNLICLYSHFFDPGFVSSCNYDAERIGDVEKKYFALVARSKNMFPTDTEVVFWEKYFQQVFLGDVFTEDECKEFAFQGNSLVPFFFLFQMSNRTNFVKETRALIAECRKALTFKSQYILSVIGGV